MMQYSIQLAFCTLQLQEIKLHSMNTAIISHYQWNYITKTNCTSLT